MVRCATGRASAWIPDTATRTAVHRAVGPARCGQPVALDRRREVRLDVLEGLLIRERGRAQGEDREGRLDRRGDLLLHQIVIRVGRREHRVRVPVEGLQDREGLVQVGDRLREVVRGGREVDEPVRAVDRTMVTS